MANLGFVNGRPGVFSLVGLCVLAGILVAIIYVGLFLAGAIALGDLGYLQS